MTRDKGYLNYVYDFEKRSFRNRFEEMYAECECPWPHQVDAENIQYRFVLECLRKDHPLRILDVGCGLGYFSNNLSRLGEVTAVDISPTCIQKAAATFPHIRFEVCDINVPLSWADASFDAVVGLGVLWFVLPRIHEVLDEFRRVLRPGGEAVFGLNIPENPIGKEVIATSQDYLDIVRSHLDIVNIFAYYHLEGTHLLSKGDIAYYLHCARPS